MPTRRMSDHEPLGLWYGGRQGEIGMEDDLTSIVTACLLPSPSLRDLGFALAAAPPGRSIVRGNESLSLVMAIKVHFTVQFFNSTSNIL